MDYEEQSIEQLRADVDKLGKAIAINEAETLFAENTDRVNLKEAIEMLRRNSNSHIPLKGKHILGLMYLARRYGNDIEQPTSEDLPDDR